MAQSFIVLRLKPASAIDAISFANSLNGLSISVYDASFGSPKAGTRGDVTPAIGTATFQAPSVQIEPAPLPPIFTYPPGTGISQHFAEVPDGLGVIQVEFESVATAVIAYNPPGPEYPGVNPRPDLRIHVERAGSRTTIDPGIYYDVALFSGGALSPDAYQSIPDDSVSAYLTLSAILDSNLASVDLSNDGAVPNYDDLLSAINTVLAADPGQTLAALISASNQPLTVDQCRNIASEIVWGVESALPVPPEVLETMYTNPPNTGGVTNTNEQDRQQFEGQLNGYYATRNAKVERLTRYVQAAVAAVWCERQTTARTEAVVRFPVNPAPTTLATVKEADVILDGALGINIPAQYFYALGAALPAQVTADQRLKLAIGAEQRQNLTALTSAYDEGVFAVPPTAPQPDVNPAQAVRLLSALAVPPSSSAPRCPVAVAAFVWADFKAYPPTSPPPDAWRTYRPGDDETGFWPGEMVTPDFLKLDLYALTQGYVIANSNPAVSLADYIAQNLRVNGSPVTSASHLAQAVESDWDDLFRSAPLPPNSSRDDLLPPFTLPGTSDARLAAFIRYVRKFFDLSSAAGAPPNATGTLPPTLPLPTGIDAILSFATQYQLLAGGTFQFGTPLEPNIVALAAANVFPGDTAAQAWLTQTVNALNDLCTLAGVPGGPMNPLAPSPEFSVAEALYARGFTSIADVLSLTQADFQDALRGTVAYDQAGTIYSKALTLGSPGGQGTQTGGPFKPVNPGSLTNCIPPCYLSPLGPVEYLHELLQLSELSTCEGPFPAPGQQGTLGDVLAGRRGPIGSLHVTRANEATPLPLIDIVNECLEAMSATPPSTHGVVRDTADEALAGHALCADDCCCHDDDRRDGELRKPHERRDCHDPAVILAALPEHSTPGIPTDATLGGRSGAFDILKTDFSSCCLPYSQPLDVARTYLRQMCTSRFEVMRTFRRCITEFVLAPENQPAGFQNHLWRYPVRIDIAIEYLCITPEEYVHVFGGRLPESCSGDQSPPPDGALGRVLDSGTAESRTGIRVPEFLEAACLTYCELLELWKSRFVDFRNAADPAQGAFPPCEPCCLDDLSIDFPGGAFGPSLSRLMIFIRLWRKVRGACRRGYSFEELADICTVLGLFSGANVNPDFIRQLAAFQMLCDTFALKLVDHRDPPAPGDTGADRLHILALWVGPTAKKWGWAVNQLLERVQHHARVGYHRPHRPELIKLLRENLDPLSVVAGFDPANVADTWHALPTHTLRFAEVLAKIATSPFNVGEIPYLVTADPHVDGDDPFPLQEGNEALDSPLGLPDDVHEFSLWKLRHKLLEVRVDNDDAYAWSWPRIAHALQQDLGFHHADVLALGEHFFPDVLTASGHHVSIANRRYTTTLAAADTAPLMWNTRPEGPFHYASGNETLWTRLPLRDGEIIEQLTHLRQLGANERRAVQNLTFAPRRTLATFALLFDDFAEAERHLIEHHEEARWTWFQRQFARCHRRCHVIAEHLTQHVQAATEQKEPEGSRVASLILRHLFADENVAASSWEKDDGGTPGVAWTPPQGGAFAALLGLSGTGLLAEYTAAGGALAWRDVSGALSVFGHERNRHNCPVPTILPALDASVPLDEQQFVTVLNGLAMRNADDAWLGGAEGFTVTWTGALLLDEAGSYEFWAGGVTPAGEAPRGEDCEHQRWRVTLKRGQHTWLLLKHNWHEEHDDAVSKVPLKRGVYELTIKLTQHRPSIHRDEDTRRQHTGFEVKYAGPDTGHRPIALPHHRLFRVAKNTTLADGITGLAGVPADFLAAYYTSTLRDIRRTYQRAFKALLFAHRFRLSAERWADRRSELGYMLEHSGRFAGRSAYRNGAAFASHAADFDFNLLPLRDDYLAPSPVQDLRVQPTAQRRRAIFDWWERTYDYTRVRGDVERESDRRLWLLFDEAEEKHPADPAYLLRHMGADARHWPLDLHYFQDQSAPIYSISYDDLEDDRWVVRAWHSDEWIQRLLRHFCAKDIRAARPDLWASNDPSGVVPGTGPDGQPNPAGNTNLSRFIVDGFIENDAPRRYEDLKRLNDCLRERGRDALLAYLCAKNRVALPWGGFAKAPNDLSSLLLIDVEAGVCERASRIEEAVTAVHNFVRRARLGLEPLWKVTHPFAQLWDRRLASFKIWQACKCRELYRENWVDWDAHETAQKVESYRFLQSELRRSTLTAALPGGLEYWPDQRPPAHPGLLPLQDREPSALTQLSPGREGLALLGTPERDARPSWLEPLSSDNRGGTGIPSASAGAPIPAPSANGQLPFWIESAIRLGVRFYRVAAGGVPPASAAFKPRRRGEAAGCCAECGRDHDAQVDEYYFWLLDARFFEVVDQKDSPSFSGPEQDDYYDLLKQNSAPWHDPEKLPTLLDWKLSPTVRLAWCRVHNGEFKQPRRSYEGVQVDPNAPPPDLMFVGRVSDSLVFRVTGGVPPTGYMGADQPGFRYDLASDSAVTLPLLADPPPATSGFPGGLPAYPYFVYVEPGAPLFPGSLFSSALAVACALRTRCRFEAALKWYAAVFDPLQRDDTWMVCDSDVIPMPVPTASVSACCDTTNVSDVVALDRSVLLHYLETLLEWGDALMRGHSPEAFQQARLIFDTAAMILGRSPASVKARPPASLQTVSTFTPLVAPLNPRLLDLYRNVEDRLCSIRHCLNALRLQDSGPRELPYWGGEACCACHTLSRPCDDGCGCSCNADGDCCPPPSPYRFQFVVQKAHELTALVRELGGALLAAFEKGDAEYLASLRAGHEVELLNLTRAIRQDQWREADWQRQGLLKSKEVAQTNRRYFATLIQNGLNGGEFQYEDLTSESIAFRVAANAVETTAQAIEPTPDLFVGFPCEESWVTGGTKLAPIFKTIARITNTVADMMAQTAGLDLTAAGFARRLDEWVHQVEVLDVEIQQIERQILAAERHEDMALHELNNHQRQTEQSTEVQNFLRDKFTSHELYLHLQKETAALHYRMFQLAWHAAEQAERAFNFERGDTARRFLPCESWDNLHEGLLAGERLQLALRTMEKEYLDRNVREYELTKHFSLRLHFPLQFLRLKTSGVCEIDVPEWMFDLDHPGQFMRRIKNVSLTIPCVAGPYTGVHCRLTLLSSSIRVDPSLTRPPGSCCDRCRCENDYEPCACDPRFIKHFGAREAIATSSGQNDTGLFEISFRDERYLPFEFLGAISRWRIELPQENNFFDMDTLSDVVMAVNYTAREGGELLRRAANEVAQCRVRYAWSLFDVRHEFPDAWQMFKSSRPEHKGERRLIVDFTRRMFPFLPCDRELIITRLAIVFETEAARRQACCKGEYECCGAPRRAARPCAHSGTHQRHCEAFACGDCEATCCCACIQCGHVVEVTPHEGHDAGGDCECEEVDVRCVGSGLYHGVTEVRLGHFHDGRRSQVSFEFPRTVGEVSRIFLMCYYQATPQACDVRTTIVTGDSRSRSPFPARNGAARSRNDPTDSRTGRGDVGRPAGER